MVFVGTLAITFAPLIIYGDGLEQLENISMKVMFGHQQQPDEHYKHSLVGNLWYLLGVKMSKTSMQLMILFFANVAMGFKVRYLNKRQALLSIILVLQTVLIFGDIKGIEQYVLYLILALMGALYNEF